MSRQAGHLSEPLSRHAFGPRSMGRLDMSPGFVLVRANHLELSPGRKRCAYRSRGDKIMAKRYNPPPNWPAPPAGWTPPRLQPDPAWGPAPQGWKLWVDDRDWFLRHKVLTGIGAFFVLIFRSAPRQVAATTRPTRPTSRRPTPLALTAPRRRRRIATPLTALPRHRASRPLLHRRRRPRSPSRSHRSAKPAETASSSSQ